MNASGNLFSIEGKNVLFISDGSELETRATNLLIENGASLTVVGYDSIDEIENQISGIPAKETFDGVVFGVVHSDFRPLSSVKPANVAMIMNDNFGAFIEYVRILKKKRLLADGCSIIAMSSISSTHPMKAKTAFCAAKAALDSSVRCLAVELGEKKIRVNSIQKGVVDADFSKAHIQDIAAISENAASEKQFLGVTSVEEIGAAMIYLLSDATKTVTGTAIVIDGGYTL